MRSDINSDPLTEPTTVSVSSTSSLPHRQVARIGLIILALHLPLFVYPIVRLGVWLELAPLTILLILVPTALSQMLSRWWLRHWFSSSSRVRRLLISHFRKLADLWLGISPLLLMTLLVFEGILLLGGVSATAAAWWVLAITGAMTLYGIGAAVLLRVSPVRFSSAQLRSPVRFVQITDLHIGSRTGRFLHQVTRRVEQLQPDFVCITGDLVDATGVTEDDLSGLQTLSCPVYYCIGNHERYEDLDAILARLTRLGVRVLRTESDYVREDIQILGIDDAEDAKQVAHELAKLEVDQKAFGILLYHRPRGLSAAASAGIDLMLSGHTHKGQIFPFNLVVRRAFARIAGLYQSGATRLYVSQGTGTWGPVMRLGTRSEITLFELTPETPAEEPAKVFNKAG